MTRIIGIKGKVLAVLALKRVPIPLESLVFADSSEKVLVLALFLNKYFIKLFLKSPIVEITISKKSTLIIMLLKIHNKKNI
jgi:TctA family transporter